MIARALTRFQERLASRAEFLLYFASSAAALGVDTVVYALAIHHGLPLSAAALIGYSCGMLLIYWLSIAVVFSSRRLKDRNIEFGVFAAVGGLGLALTEILLWMLTTMLAIDPLAAKLLTAAMVFVFNYVARKFLLFTRRNDIH
ncbi:GtrA family protein [Paucibacter sp. APW11]|uniref:GtrA family protein n=1 Tax=Roseateles aquae TaxID=3077235 RepID=A0ABU3PEN5_9BURK|nr:GtrA family protein [Paucibacter sp. APW11]MDT9001004.1 GtrA family protein [Paucibacter sp. APW11]